MSLPNGTYAELKRGRKLCPNCEAIIGAGRRKCPACEYAFGAAKENNEESEKPKHRRVLHLVVPGTEIEGCNQVLIIPAGRCPNKLTSSEPAVVKQWMLDVAAAYADEGRRRRTMLTVESLCWWAREFFPLGSVGHTQVKAILQAQVSPQICG